MFYKEIAADSVLAGFILATVAGVGAGQTFWLRPGWLNRTHFSGQGPRSTETALEFEVGWNKLFVALFCRIDYHISRVGRPVQSDPSRRRIEIGCFAPSGLFWLLDVLRRVLSGVVLSCRVAAEGANDSRKMLTLKGARPSGRAPNRDAGSLLNPEIQLRDGGRDSHPIGRSRGRQGGPRSGQVGRLLESALGPDELQIGSGKLSSDSHRPRPRQDGDAAGTG
jgi:hypothetical protein